MAKKKEVGITRKITEFFQKKPSSSTGLSIASSNQADTQRLVDKTNLNPMERQHCIQVNGHLPQNRNVIRTNPKSSNSLKTNLTKNNPTFDMAQDTVTLENDEGKLIVVGKVGNENLKATLKIRTQYLLLKLKMKKAHLVVQCFLLVEGLCLQTKWCSCPRLGSCKLMGWSKANGMKQL
jgi:hypothetical protein